ncbi:MAG: 4-hydroxy-tetrahydrodipicolinate reductase [Saprospiraceae bacterium]
MKIALIGYGKMGKTIERLAKEQGHEIVLIIDRDNQADFTVENLQRAEVAIEFTQPDVAFQNALTCFEAGVPIVSGTTGWGDKMRQVREICLAQNGTLLHTTNFSVGVNIFFAINQRLAQLMNRQQQYSVAMEEIHHTEKKDAPSGTAITLAEGIIDNMERKEQWINKSAVTTADLPIISKRIDRVPGTHAVVYQSEIDTIDIKHTAHSRDGFALGAILAAEYIKDRKGCFAMSDVLGL